MTSVKLKCKECMEVFYEDEAKETQAGRKEDGTMMYNTECPGCGAVDTMSHKYFGVPEELLEDYKNGDVTYEEVINGQTDEQVKEDKKRL